MPFVLDNSVVSGWYPAIRRTPAPKRSRSDCVATGYSGGNAARAERSHASGRKPVAAPIQ